MFIVFGMPLPLSTQLILCVDLGTDMIPAISLAYEGPEADIMRRPPRNSKTDHLVTAKLIGFSYLQIGVIQAMAGFYVYFIVLADFGYHPSLLFGIGDSWSHAVYGRAGYFVLTNPKSVAYKKAGTVNYIAGTGLLGAGYGMWFSDVKYKGITYDEKHLPMYEGANADQTVITYNGSTPLTLGIMLEKNMNCALSQP